MTQFERNSAVRSRRAGRLSHLPLVGPIHWSLRLPVRPGRATLAGGRRDLPADRHGRIVDVTHRDYRPGLRRAGSAVRRGDRSVTGPPVMRSYLGVLRSLAINFGRVRDRAYRWS